MKKIIILIGIVMILLVSCTKDCSKKGSCEGLQYIGVNETIADEERNITGLYSRGFNASILGLDFSYNVTRENVIAYFKNNESIIEISRNCVRIYCEDRNMAFCFRCKGILQ